MERSKGVIIAALPPDKKGRAMATESLLWTDRAGAIHELRPARNLASTERQQLDLLRQQVHYTADLLEAGFEAAAIAQAPTRMVRMMLHILLPDVAEAEIATFDPTKATISSQPGGQSPKPLVE
jgi:hypothetical protein